MLIRMTLGLAVTFSAALALSATAADEPKKETAVACPVSGKPIDKANSLPYKDAQVYFCCPNCPKAFKADTAKFAAKANHQLVATEQAKQKACPITGQPAKDAQAVAVGGVDVHFCCPNCKGKVAKAEPAEQINLVFADKSFEKGFEVKKAEKK